MYLKFGTFYFCQFLVPYSLIIIDVKSMKEMLYHIPTAPALSLANISSFEANHHKQHYIDTYPQNLLLLLVEYNMSSYKYAIPF